MDKKYIRNKYLNIRNTFSDNYIDNVSKKISKNLFSLPIYKQAETIFIYIHTNKEIKTNFIIEQALKDNKNICCPVLTGNKYEMVFKQYNKNNLVKNKFNILEPIYEKQKISDNKTLIVAPALVFNKNKYRIGYGGGYYDNFLKDNEYIASVALCFSSFTENFIPDVFDVAVHTIITEKYIY